MDSYYDMQLHVLCESTLQCVGERSQCVMVVRSRLGGPPLINLFYVSEVVLMSVDEEDEYPDKGPLSPISHQSSLNTERTLSRYKKLRTGKFSVGAFY